MNVRLDHETIMDGRYHVITSLDIKGFYVTARSEEQARLDADAILELIRLDRERHPEMHEVPQPARAAI